MKTTKKTLAIAVMAVLTLASSGCDRFSRKPTNDTKPAKLVKLSQESAGLSSVFSANLPQSGKFKGAKKSVGSDLHVAPISDGLIAASRSGIVSAYSGANVKWTANVNAGITSGVASNDAVAVVGTKAGEIIALNAATGEVLWKKSLPSSVITPAKIQGERVLLSANNGVIYALDVNSGEQVWQFSTQGDAISVRGTATPISIDSATALFGTADGRIHAINPQSGTPLWSRRIGRAVGGSQVNRMNDVDGSPLTVGRFLYVPSYSGQLAAYDMSSGQSLFVAELASNKTLALSNNQLIGVSINGEVVAFNPLTGEKLWANDELKYRKLTNPVAIGDVVAVGDYEGVIHLFDQNGKIVGRNKTKGALISLDVQNNQIYTQSDEDVVSVWRLR